VFNLLRLIRAQSNDLTNSGKVDQKLIRWRTSLYTLVVSERADGGAGKQKAIFTSFLLQRVYSPGC
jgi:hypothetical protein